MQNKIITMKKYVKKNPKFLMLRFLIFQKASCFTMPFFSKEKDF